MFFILILTYRDAMQYNKCSADSVLLNLAQRFSVQSADTSADAQDRVLRCIALLDLVHRRWSIDQTLPQLRVAKPSTP